MHETKGNCNLTGESTEKGCYQYMPETWKAYSNQVAGRVLPHNPENEEYVAMKMIETWLEQGLSTKQAILRWNHPAGVRTGCSSGVNAHGVAWNSCDYQEKVLAILYKRTNYAR